MSIPIRIRRGTDAELATITLLQGEMGLTTDKYEVWIGDGSGNILVGRAVVDTLANRPTAGKQGRIFHASDTHDTYVDDGSSWQSMTAVSTHASTHIQGGSDEVDGDKLDIDVSLTNITPDTTPSEVDDAGQLGAIIAGIDNELGDKADKVSGATSGNLAGLDANGNLTDSGLAKNDSGTGTDDLWSADKIANEIQDKVNGLAWKEPVDLATTADITLSGEQTIDGNTTSGSRVLVKDQTDKSENGIYVTSSGSWTRATDLDSSTEFNAATVRVLTGTANADTAWTQTTDDPTVGTSDIVWVQTNGAGEITAGTGLTKSGNTLNVGDVNRGVQVNADDLEIDGSEVAGNGLTENGTNSWQLDVQADSTGGSNLATVVNVSANGVAVKIDDDSIQENGSNQLYVASVDGGSFV